MRLFFASTPSKQYIDALVEYKAANILVSYAYYKEPEKYEKLSDGYYPEMLLVDSGAFSVWTKGDTIDIDKYLEYCKKVKKISKCKTHFVNLDVLPGKFGQHPTKEQREHSAEEGWKNWEYLKNKGLNTIPVFHQHEDFSWLEKMAKATDYIGISPANDLPNSQKIRWLDKVFSILQNTRRTHCFGATSAKILLAYPFYSADSSSWISGARFARLPNFSKGKGKSFQFKDKEQFLKNWDKLSLKDTGLLEDYKVRIRHGIKSFQELEKFVTSVWEARGVKL